MRARNWAIMLLAGRLALSSCTSTPQVTEGEYLIEGVVKNVPDSVVVRFMEREGNLLQTIGRDTIINGKFSFRYSVQDTTPQKIALSFREKGFPGKLLYVWVQSGKYTKITGDDCLHPLWNVSSEIAEQQAANQFNALCPTERKLYLQLNMLEYDLRRSEDLYNNLEMIDSLIRMEEPLDSLISLAELNYMKEAPITSVWLDKYRQYSSFLVNDREFGHRELIRSLYDRMSDADKATEAGQEITGYLNAPEPINIGDDMVDSDLYDVNGEIHHLSEFKGKYILLDFWSQGCGPCLQAFPELEEVAEQYKDKMTIVSISLDDKEQWKEYIARKQLKGIQWNELRNGLTGLAAVYEAVGIPRYVIISPDGKVLQMWTGYFKGLLKSTVSELIK